MYISSNTANQFSQALLNWYQLYGRKDLPWQKPREPYRVWVSEIMLQQTQVQTVIPYFNRFIQHFPTIQDLAQAEDDQVLALWSGLGYYSRARNLHKSAKIINQDYAGVFPANLESLLALPGIGPSTAGAILSQAFNQAEAILDGNVKRVLARVFLVKGQTEQVDVRNKLWDLARACMPKQQCAEYTQAIMDLGATCCTKNKPNCLQCPLQSQCQAFKLGEQLLYPSKKIRKPVPLHHTQFLVLTNKEGEIYLEKRPPVGLWGGLWYLPSIALEQCPLHFIKDTYGLIGKQALPLMELKHKFSHFHLQIKALQIKINISNQSLFDSKGMWIKKEQLHSIGLAKPTTLILTKLT